MPTTNYYVLWSKAWIIDKYYFLPMLHLFDQKYSKTSNIVKYYNFYVNIFKNVFLWCTSEFFV